MKAILLLLCLLCLAVPASAQSDAGTPGDWKLETFFLPTDGVFEGDDVISAEVDIDGDGVVERVVTLRMSSRNAKAGNIWGVFSQSGDAFRYRGDITFRRDFGVIAVIPQVSLKPRLYSPRNGAVMSFGISGGKAYETDEAGVTLDDFKAAAAQGKKPEYRQIPAAELYYKYSPEELKGVVIEEDVAEAPAKPRRSRLPGSPIPPPAAVESQARARVKDEPGSGGAWKLGIAAGVLLAAAVAYVSFRKKT